MTLQFHPYQDPRPSANDYVQQWGQQLNAIGNTVEHGRERALAERRQAMLDQYLKQEQGRKTAEFNYEYRDPLVRPNPDTSGDVPQQPQQPSMFGGQAPSQGSSLIEQWNQKMGAPGQPQAPSFRGVSGNTDPYAGMSPEMKQYASMLGAKNRAGYATAYKDFGDSATRNAEVDLKKAQARWYNERPTTSANATSPYGKPPVGYRFRDDGSLEPIPGGKADLESQKQDQLVAGQMTQADIIIKKVDQALSKVSGWTAGFGGKMAGVPMTGAHNLHSDLETIKANLGFQQLQDMRRTSPTGGALGQVSERELTALQSALASLDQEQSPDQLTDRLNEIKTHYQNWKATVQQSNGDGGFDGGGSQEVERRTRDGRIGVFDASTKSFIRWK